MSVTWLEDRVAGVRDTAWRGRVVGAAVLLVLTAALGGAAWWAWDTGRLDTAQVTVTGTERTDALLVHDLAAGALGKPLLLVDVGAISTAVTGLPLVLEARVERRWPRTLEVHVVERVAVAAVPAPGGGYRLLDLEGVVLAELDEPPAAVPVLSVDVDRAGVESLEAAREVLQALPADLQRRVSDVSADSPADVRLVVDGKPVRWGSATEPARKVAVLEQLLAGVPASSYDVSAPGAPAVRP